MKKLKYSLPSNYDVSGQNVYICVVLYDENRDVFYSTVLKKRNINNLLLSGNMINWLKDKVKEDLNVTNVIINKDV